MFTNGPEFEPRLKIPGLEEIPVQLDQTTDVIRDGRPYAAFSLGSLKRAVRSMGYEISDLPDDSLMFVPSSEPREALYRTFYGGKLIIDVPSKMLTVHGSEVEVAAREFETLELLSSRPGSLWKIEVIMNRVWGESYKDAGTDSTVRVHIKRLRDKITANGLPGMDVIQTVRGGGYRFNPEIE